MRIDYFALRPLLFRFGVEKEQKKTLLTPPSLDNDTKYLGLQYYPPCWFSPVVLGCIRTECPVLTMGSLTVFFGSLRDSSYHIWTYGCDPITLKFKNSPVL